MNRSTMKHSILLTLIYANVGIKYIQLYYVIILNIYVTIMYLYIFKMIWKKFCVIKINQEFFLILHTSLYSLIVIFLWFSFTFSNRNTCLY